MILYSKFNPERKICFQLISRVRKANNIKIFTKSAVNKESVPHLNSFYNKYDYLKKNNFSFVPIKPQPISTTEILFEYQNGSNLENLLLLSLQNIDKEKFVSLIKAYIKSIKNNVIRSEFISSKFIKIFGNTNPSKKFECLQVGCVDLNFDNIFYNTKSNRYRLVDYEWTFDNISIPYKYIIFRAISTFYFKFIEYDPNKFISLKDIYKITKITPSEQRLFIGFEYNFQVYVHGDKVKKYVKIKDFHNEYLKLEEIDHSNVNIISEKQDLTQQISTANSEKQDLTQQISTANSEKQDLTQQISQITSSKFYKTWRVYCRIKDFIKQI